VCHATTGKELRKFAEGKHLHGGFAASVIIWGPFHSLGLMSYL
jgi:hypothetical protein